jgi:hypothetical protein
VARSLDPAPGPPGLLYGGRFLAPSINALGQVLFQAELTGAGVTTTDDEALYLTDAAGSVQQLVRKGDSLELNPGDPGTVRFLVPYASSGGSDGRPRVLSDDGTVVFVADFTDGRSGAFLTSLTATCPDGDEDAICDADDNCPFHPTGNLADTDDDGRGDECECSDQNGDGSTTVSDLIAINVAIFSPELATPLCDGNNDDQCDVRDLIAANIEIFSPGTSICSRQPERGP